MARININRRAIGLVLVLIIFGALLIWYNMKNAPAVEATMSDKVGVSPQTEFLVRVSDEPTVDELRGRIATQPDISFYIALDEETGKYRLFPVTPLESGSDFSIFVDGRRHNFKVRNELIVRHYTPFK